jgi:hypothetical protein
VPTKRGAERPTTVMFVPLAARCVICRACDVVGKVGMAALAGCVVFLVFVMILITLSPAAMVTEAAVIAVTLRGCNA